MKQTGGRFEPSDQVVELRDAELRGVDLSGLRLDAYDALGSVLDDCDLRGLKARSGRMSGVEVPTLYRGCAFAYADLRALKPGPARFERCTFEDTRLDGWICNAAEFVECRFVGHLTDISFWGETFPDALRARLKRSANDFRGNDFRDAELTLVAFVGGIDVDAQEMPSGSGYVHVVNLRARVAEARAAVASWPENDREFAERMLQGLGEAGYESQRAFFGRRSEPRFVPDAVRDRVWALLEKS